MYLKWQCYWKLHGKKLGRRGVQSCDLQITCFLFETRWFWVLIPQFWSIILPLKDSHWPPGLEAATILSIATNSKLIWSKYIHQSSRLTAWLTTPGSFYLIIPSSPKCVHKTGPLQQCNSVTFLLMDALHHSLCLNKAYIKIIHEKVSSAGLLSD